MGQKHFLGVDIGTYETKAVLCGPDGRIAATAAHPHKMAVPRPGWAEHSPEQDWWQGFTRTARQVLAESGVEPRDVAAVAASAIGPCVVPVGPDDQPLTNAILYGVDTRAHAEIVELEAEIGPDAILEFNGNALTSQAVGPKILWLRRNRPAEFKAASKFVSSTTYLVRKLTGAWVVDHYTAANFTPLYNSHSQCWDNRLHGGIVELERLPAIKWSTEIAGVITAEAAIETGLAEGTPVTVGTIDAAAEAVSAGIREPGEIMMMYGSTMFFIALADEWKPDPKLWYAPWLFSGRHAYLGGLATSGTLTHWFKDNFARDLQGEDAFAKLAEEAAGSPKGANGLIVLPYFSGERTPIHDPEAKGCIFGLDLTHTRADICRAIFEGIAYGTRHAIEAFPRAGGSPHRLFAVGGGTKNAVWMQSTSDICRSNQTVRSVTLGASFGDAFLAAVATGEARQADISEWNPVAREVSAAKDGPFESGYGIFRDLYRRTRDLMGAAGASR